MGDYEELTCPFCKETEFDAPGLKMHLLRGYCDAFEKVDVLDGAITIFSVTAPPELQGAS